MGNERALNLSSGYLTCHKFIIAEYGSGHPSGLISHEIVGSNPTSATKMPRWWNGIHDGLRNHCRKD